MMYEPHEYCLAFPEMPPDQFRQLSADIKANGLLHEIVLYEGKILDGRHRYRACVEHGIEPAFTQYLGSDPSGFVASENARRRHLSQSQLGMVGTNLAEVESERARKRQTELAGNRPTLDPHGSKVSESGRTAEIIGDKLGIGKNTVQRAIKVKKHGVPEVVKAVEDGKVTVTEAARIVDLKPHTQRQIIEIDDRRERAKMLGTRMQQSNVKKALNKNRQRTSGDVYVPGTPFVKRLLARAEMMLNDVVSEGGFDDPTELARLFLREFDWSSDPLRLQLSHCEKLFEMCAVIRGELQRSRAA